MDYNDIEFDESDYEFFTSLDTEEKLLFLFDLLCTNFYEESSESDVVVPATYEELTGPLRDTVVSTIDYAFSSEANVNIVFINDFIVINSDNEKILKSSAREIFMRGFVISEMKINEKDRDLFQRSTYYRVYSIIGRNDPIIKN